MSLVLFASSCTPAATPAPEPAAPSAREASTSPREVEFAYKSSEGEDAPDRGGEGRRRRGDGDPPSTAALPEPTELSAVAERAVVEAMSDHPSVLLTPALPIEWPAKAKAVAYFAYPIEPLESGVTKWQVGRAIARVVVKLDDKTASVEPIAQKNKKPLGTFENKRASSTDPIHVAERSLIAIVAGQGDAEKLRHRLRPTPSGWTRTRWYARTCASVRLLSSPGSRPNRNKNGDIWGGTGIPGKWQPALSTWTAIAGSINNYGVGLAEDTMGRMWVGIVGGIQAIDVETMALGPTVMFAGESIQSKGMSVDVDSFIWAVPDSSNHAYRVDPDDFTYETVNGLIGAYTYSDMTGGAIKVAVACTPPRG